MNPVLTHTPDLSSFEMSANEIRSMAIAAIASIKAIRDRATNEAFEIVKHQRCKRFFGLYSHRRYPTKEIAAEHAPEVLMAQKLAFEDMLTCRVLKDVAEFILDSNEPNRKVRVTINDYRALIAHVKSR